MVSKGEWSKLFWDSASGTSVSLARLTLVPEAIAPLFQNLIKTRSHNVPQAIAFIRVNLRRMT